MGGNTETNNRNFSREVENEMQQNDGSSRGVGSRLGKGKLQPPSFDPAQKGLDFFDV